MYLTGFADEAADGIEEQIRATKELGWSNIESRKIDNVNIHDISDEQFGVVCETLADAGIRINCFGSAIANWAKKISDTPETSYAELRRAIPRMHVLGTRLIRVMSFVVPEDESINDPAITNEVIARMQHLTKMAEDSGVILVHENCDNWGGRSYKHTLMLLDRIQSPNLKLVFDTGNPVFRKDVRGKPPYRYQSAIEFYNNVKDHVVYIHIKDGKMVDGKMNFSFPGEGDGDVREILIDLQKRGFDGGISIEPHLAAVAHDPTVQSTTQVKYANYVEYGKRLELILDDIGWKTAASPALSI